MNDLLGVTLLLASAAFVALILRAACRLSDALGRQMAADFVDRFRDPGRVDRHGFMAETPFRLSRGLSFEGSGGDGGGCGAGGSCGGDGGG